MQKATVFTILFITALIYSLFQEDLKIAGISTAGLLVCLDLMFTKQDNNSLEQDIEETFYLLKEVTETFETDNKEEFALMKKIRNFLGNEDNN